MPTKVLTDCPDCYGEGKVYEGCPDCLSEGCKRCNGIGDISSTCAVCNGSGKITEGFAKVREGYRAAMRHDEDCTVRRVSFLSRSNPGITMYALADYYQQRDNLRGKVAYVECKPNSPISQNGIPFECHAVFMMNANGQPLYSFWGYSWGFGGEGPTGLAAMLSDLFDTDFDEMRQVVGSHDIESAWRMSAEGLMHYQL
jgi:hypothetical protein